MSALEAAVGGVRRAQRRRRALIGAAVGVGAAGMMAWAGQSGAWVAEAWVAGVWVAGLTPVAVAIGWPAPARAAAERLDAAAGLDAALVCAWDHRERGGAMVEAQRAQALAGLSARGRVRAVPRPSPLWALCGLVWLGPLMAGGVAVEPAGVVGGDGVPIEAGEAPRAAEAATPVVAEERGARAQASPPSADEPDAGIAEGDGGPGGPPTGVAERGGVGAEAADQRGVGAGRGEVAMRAGDGVGLRVPVAGGDAVASGEAGRAVVGRTPPPPDAIADPARPYPSRYRRVIAAWFDRGAQ